MKYVKLSFLLCLFFGLKEKSHAFFFRDSSDTPIIQSAAQDQMEAGTVQNRVVVPALQQNHPSSAKGWVMFQGTATVTINASYNVSSITDNGTGDYTVNWNTDFSGANYAAVGMAFHDPGVYASWCFIGDTGANTAGSLRINVLDNPNFQVRDAEQVHVVAYGDQ